MSRLREVLGSYADVEPAPAGGDARRRISEEARKRLRTDLARVQRRNERLLWLAAILLVALFAVWLVVVFVAIRNPTMVQGTSAALGLTAAGSIRWLLGIWREKTNTEMLVRLAIDLEGEALQTVINLLARGKRI